MGFDGAVAMVSRESDHMPEAGQSFIGDSVSQLRCKLAMLLGNDTKVDRFFPKTGIRLRVKKSVQIVEGEVLETRKEVFFILCEGTKASPIVMTDPRVGSAKGCEVFSLNLEIPDGKDNQAFDLMCEVVTVDTVKKGWLSRRRGLLRGNGLDLTIDAVDFVVSLE
jgi:hypothetical protein